LIDRDEQIARIKQTSTEHLREGYKRKATAWKKWRQRAKAARKLGESYPAFRAKQAVEDAEVPGTNALPRHVVDPFAATATATIPANVRANNPIGDGAGAGQAESAIAAWGDYVMVAWNDGQGFVTGPDIQGFGYSIDGGQTFVDGGVPAKLVGWVWTSDPVMTVNEKTGEFYYCGLVNPTANTNGLAMVRGTFSGTTLTWDTPRLIRSVNNASAFIDKQWMVCDSLTGNLYVTYTIFVPGGNSIQFQRSLDDGVSWSTQIQLSSGGDNNRVQGSRPVVGPDGEVYATWSAIGTGVQDFFRIRKSTDQGVTFTTQVNAAAYVSNFGTGAPGFNRERGISFPSIAVDRTTGPNRGRVYVTWNECYDHYEDFFNGVPSNVEAEPNGTSAQATPFTVGNIIRGAISTGTELDYFSVNLNAGQHLVLWADSLSSTLLYTLRVFAPDGVQRLAFAGDLNAPGGALSYYTFTAPVTGTYFVRVAGNNATGAYMVRTTFGVVDDPSRATDSRDIYMSSSDNGTTWTTPVQVNDTGVGFHEWLPEVAVGSDGNPYIFWFDWRDDTHGSRSHQYMSRSTDGGATWEANQRFSSVQNNWTTIGSNIAPNQGDYSHFYADERFVRPTWADGRDGDVNVYATAVDTWHTFDTCAADASGDPQDIVPLTWTVKNENELFGNDLDYAISDERGWLTGTTGSLSLAADASGDIDLDVAIPDSADAGVNTICVTVTNASGTQSIECCLALTINAGSTGVGDGPLAFALRQSVPTPASGPTRIDFSLPRAGNVTLAIYGLRGERVRTLASGERGPGHHSVTWDGRDERGQRVEAGTYFYRLEGLGQSATRRLVWMP
jgi:hypothetical protein